MMGAVDSFPQRIVWPRSKSFGWITHSHLIDWLLAVFMFAAFPAINAMFDAHKRPVPWKDRSIWFPELSPTVSVFTLHLVGLLLLLGMKIDTYRVHSWHGVITTAYGFLVGYGPIECVAASIRLGVGRLRPDFVSRCLGPELYDEYLANDRVVPIEVQQHVEENGCPKDHDGDNPGWRSFPSGHALTVFIMTTYVAIYLGVRIGVADGNRQLWKLAVPFLPIMFALYTAVSRVSDYGHFWDDVLVGSLLGIVGGLFGYMMAFDWEGAPRNRFASNKHNTPPATHTRVTWSTPAPRQKSRRAHVPPLVGDGHHNTSLTEFDDASSSKEGEGWVDGAAAASPELELELDLEGGLASSAGSSFPHGLTQRRGVGGRGGGDGRGGGARGGDRGGGGGGGGGGDVVIRPVAPVVASGIYAKRGVGVSVSRVVLSSRRGRRQKKRGAAAAPNGGSTHPHKQKRQQQQQQQPEKTCGDGGAAAEEEERRGSSVERAQEVQEAEGVGGGRRPSYELVGGVAVAVPADDLA